MRKLLVALLCLGAIALALAAPASAGPLAAPSAPSVLFAGGGTAVSNGYFFPGTAIYDGNQFQGVPLQVPQGSNVTFVNTDYSPLTNVHSIVSFKRHRGKPLFSSGVVTGPGQGLLVTSDLKPGVYPYFCSIHFGMYGLIQIVKQ
ncbi:MAG: plastocyanin/azurin family copper-binding protein [Actinomycetota bacterium]